MNIKDYKLEEGPQGLELVIYLDESDTEFSFEFGGKIYKSIEKYIRENLKGLKIVAIKIMLGSMLITSATLTGVLSAAVASAASASHNQAPVSLTYRVLPGDTLWLISRKFGVTIAELKAWNNLTGDMIVPGQTLAIPGQKLVTKSVFSYHNVDAGESLWSISRRYGTTVEEIQRINNMGGIVIYPGQRLKVGESVLQGVNYTVKAGDSLWNIAQRYGSTVTAVKFGNGLANDIIHPGQILFVPIHYPDLNKGSPKEPTIIPAPVHDWPDVTYIVKPGDTLTAVAKKFGTTPDEVMKFNYMEPGEWLNSGERIAISGYAPRTYTVTPGESTAPARKGKMVDWVLEGQYLLKRGHDMTIVDVDTGKQLRVRMIGGFNHADVEPLTSGDTEVMKSLFGTWMWAPRAVVIFKDGMNIAASLSGMPHGEDTIGNNSVSGHFDLYLKNSAPHSGSTSTAYVTQHYDMIRKAGS